LETQEAAKEMAHLLGWTTIAAGGVTVVWGLFENASGAVSVSVWRLFIYVAILLLLGVSIFRFSRAASLVAALLILLYLFALPAVAPSLRLVAVILFLFIGPVCVNGVRATLSGTDSSSLSDR